MGWSITDSELEPDSPITSSLMFRLRNGGIEPLAVTVFHQSAAPLGWTKLTDIDDRAIRISSGTPSDGGSVDFSVAFGRTDTDDHALTPAEGPIHNHQWTRGTEPVPFGGAFAAVSAQPGGTGNVTVPTTNAGSGAGHKHPIDLRVRYIGMIRCQKD